MLSDHDQFGAQGRRWLGSIPMMFGLMARSTVERRLPRPPFKMPDRTKSMARLRDLLEDGSLTPVVARTSPLEQASDAIEFLASGQGVGQIVVVPWGHQRGSAEAGTCALDTLLRVTASVSDRLPPCPARTH